MDLSFTDEQNLLRETVRELCEKHCAPQVVRDLEDDPAGYRDDLWNALATLGLTGLAIAETDGGTGGSTLDLVILYEELGRALAPSPHLVSAVASAGMLRALDELELLPHIASGEAIVTLAVAEAGAPDGDASIGARATPAGDIWHLQGEKIVVPFARASSHIIVLARTLRGVSAFLTQPGAVTLEQEMTMASDASYRVQLDGAPATLLGGDGEGWSAFERSMRSTLIAIAAYCVGAADRAHGMAVEYAKERVQFDKPIGSFQGVAHPLADMATEIAGARVLTYEAAWNLDRGGTALALSAMAKLYAADVFKRATKWGQQIFGGIGFTRDIDMQLYFRRAKQLEITWWGPRYLEGLIATAELDASEPFVSMDTRVR